MFRLILIIVFVLSGCVTQLPESSQEPSLAQSSFIDRYLRSEGIGAALFSPKGDRIVFERIRPYSDIGDYSFRDYAGLNVSGQQIWVANTQNKDQPVLLPGLDQLPSTYIESFSPDGEYLSFYQYSDGHLRQGFYHFKSRQSYFLPYEPKLNRVSQYQPIWIGSKEIVVAAHIEDQHSLDYVYRPKTAEFLVRSWKDAWRGERSTATVLTNSRGPVEIPGLLLWVDVENQITTVLAHGDYRNILLSPNEKKIAAIRQQTKPTNPLPTIDDSQVETVGTLVVFDLQNGSSKSADASLNVSTGSLDWHYSSENVAFFAWPVGTGPRRGRYHSFDLKQNAVVSFRSDNIQIASDEETGIPRPHRAAHFGDGLAVYAYSELTDNTLSFSYPNWAEPDDRRADWFLLRTEQAPENLTEELDDTSPYLNYASNDTLVFVSSSGLTELSATETSSIAPIKDALYISWNSSRRIGYRPYLATKPLKAEVVSEWRSAEDKGLLIVDYSSESEPVTSISHAAEGQLRFLAASAKSNSALVLHGEGYEQELHLVNAFGESRLLARLESPLGNQRVGTWRDVEYTLQNPSVNGSKVDVTACYQLPRDFNPTAQYALVVDVYPQIRSCRNLPISSANGFQFYNRDYWADIGVIYIRPPTPRTIIRTEGGPIEGIDEAVQYAIDAMLETGFVDPDRVFLFGASQGGPTSLYVASKLEGLAGTISMNGWTNNYGYYFGGGLATSVLREPSGNFSRYESLNGTSFGLGYMPFDEPMRYLENSPIHLAEGVSAPMLLVHSDFDQMPMHQYTEYYAAMSRLGKTVKYVRYWGEGHQISNPANIIHFWSTIESFIGIDKVH